MKLEYNLTFLDVIIRLIAVMVLAIVGWYTEVFFFFVLGMGALVTALTGFCPFGSIAGKEKDCKP